MASIGAVVKQITETLSDAVSQLMLLVIVLQEKNAVVPPQLPPAAQVVGGAAENLVKIAINVAESGYADYPDIKKQIIDAALTLKSAKDALIQAVNVLSSGSSDRKTGWDGLVNACKVIAAKTILLLEIVYGAEIERIKQSSEVVSNQLSTVNANQALASPDKFVEDIGLLTSKINQTAAYVKGKANDTESPLLKQQLAELSNKLEDHSDELVRRANELLQDPANEEKKQNFNQELQDIKKDLATVGELAAQTAIAAQAAQVEEMEEAVAPAREAPSNEAISLSQLEGEHVKGLLLAAKKGDKKATEDIADKLQTTTAKLVAQSLEEAKNSNDPERRQALQDSIEELEELVPQQIQAALLLADGPNSDSSDNLQELTETIEEVLSDIAGPRAELATAILDQGDDLDELVSAAKSVDTQKLGNAAKKIQKSNAKLAKQSRAMAEKTTDPTKKKNLNHVADELEKLLPQQLVAAKAVLENPDDERKMEQLEELVDQINNLVGQLDPNNVAAIAKEVKEKSKTLKEKANKGDKAGTEPAAKEAQKAANELSRQAKTESKHQRDPITKQHLDDAANELDSVIGQLITASKELAANPKDARLQEKADNVLRNLNEVVDTLAGAVQKGEQLHNVEELQTAAKKGDKEGVKQAMKKINKAGSKIARQARAEAASVSDPARKKQLNDIADTLEVLIPQQEALAQRVVSDPNNADLQESLEDLAEEMLENIADYASPVAALASLNEKEELALEELLDAAKSGDKAKTAKVGSRLAKNHAKLVGKVKADAQRAKENPERSKQLLDTCNQLDNLIAQEVKAANDLANNPKDKNTLDQLEKLNDEIEDLLEKLLQPDAVLTSQLEVKEVEKLVSAAKSGDAKGVEQKCEELPKLTSKLVVQAKALARGTDNPLRKKQILDAVDELELLIPQEIVVAREVAKSPSFDTAKEKLEGITAEIKDALSEIGGPNSTLAIAASKQLEQAEKLTELAAKGDQKAVDDRSKKVTKSGAKVAKKLKAAANRVDDPIRKQQILESIAELESLIPLEVAAALTLVKNPKDVVAKQKLEALNEQMRDDIQELTDPAFGFSRSAKREEEQLGKLLDLAKKGDKKGVEEEAQKLLQNTAKLTAQARIVASSSADPDKIKKKQILDSSDLLQKIIPEEIAFAQAVAAAPNDTQKNASLQDTDSKAKETLSDLVSSFETPFLETAKVEATQLDDLVAAAEQNKPKEVEESLKKLQKVNSLLVKQGKVEARKTNNPERKKQLQEATEEIEKLVPKEMELAKKLAANPNDKQAKESLANIDNQVKQAIDKMLTSPIASSIKKVEDDSEKLARSVLSAEPKIVSAAAQELLTNSARLKKEVNDANKGDHDLNQDLAKALNNLDDLIAAEIAQALEALKANKANNNNNTSHGLQLAKEKVRSQLADIEHAANPSYQTQLAAAGEKELQALQKLAAAAKSKNSPALYDALKDVEKHNHKLESLSASEAPRSTDPNEKKALHAAATSLPVYLKSFQNSAKKVAANPQDNAELQNLQTEQNKLEAAVKQLLDGTKAPIIAQAEKCKLSEKKLQRAAQAEDLQTAHQLAKELAQDVPKLAKSLREEAGKLSDSGKKKALEDLATNLENQNKNCIAAAVAVGKNPKNEELKNQLEGQTNQMEGLLDQVPALLTSSQRRFLTPGAKRTITREEEPDFAKQLRELRAGLRPTTDSLKKNPNDPKAIGELKEVFKRIQENGTPFKGTPQEEVRALCHKEQNELDELAKAVYAKNAPLMAASAKSYAATNAKIVAGARKEAANLDPIRKQQINKVADELEKQTPKIITSAKDALLNPNDTKAKEDLRDVLNETEHLLAQLDDTLRPIQLKNKELEGSTKEANVVLDKMLQASREGDQKGIADGAREFVPAITKLNAWAEQEANATKEPKRKLELIEASDQLRNQIPALINAAKKVITQPDDKAAKKEFRNLLGEAKANVNQLSAADSPTHKTEKIYAASKKTEAELRKIQHAAHQGDKAALTASAATLQREAKKLSDSALEAASPSEKEHLKETSTQLLASAKKVAAASEAVAGNSNDSTLQQLQQEVLSLKDLISDVVDVSNVEPKVSAMAINNRMIRVADTYSAVNNGTDLLNAALSLSNMMSSLSSIDISEYLQDGPITISSNNINLDDLLKDLGVLAAKSPNAKPVPSSAADIEKMLADLSSLSISTPAAAVGKQAMKKVPSARVAIPEKETFEDNLEAIATHIKSATENATKELSVQVGNDPILANANNVAAELAKIATAAKKGERQALILSGRKVYEHVIDLEKEIKALAAKTKDPKLQDRLIRAAEALRNYSTQLKILSAVKAAGGDKDSDDQLVSCSRALGYMLSDALSTVTETKLRERK